MTKNKIISLNKFTKKEKIGEGTQANVYLLVENDTKKNYAGKFYLRSCSKVSDRNLISSEFNKLQELDNPAVLKTYYYSVKDYDKKSYPTLISEYMSHSSLDKVFLGDIPTAQQKEWKKIKKYIVALGIAFGMTYLHDNDIVHGDLCPSKVLLDDDFYPHITGFQLNNDPEAPSFLSGKPTEDKNPCYIAPEILLDCSQCSKEADVYSYAMIVYQLLTDIQPFKSYSKTRLTKAIQNQERPEIPHEYGQIISEFFDSCWCENPEQRLTFEAIIPFLLDKEFKKKFGLFDDSEVSTYQSIFKDSIFSTSMYKKSITDIFDATLAKALTKSSDDSESDLPIKGEVTIDALEDKLRDEIARRKELEEEIRKLRDKNRTLENENTHFKDEIYQLKNYKIKLQKLNTALQTQLKEEKNKAPSKKAPEEPVIEPIEKIPKKKVKFLDLQDIEALKREGILGRGTSSKVYKVVRNENLALKIFDTNGIECEKKDRPGDGLAFDAKETEKKRKNLMYRFKHFIGEYEILNTLDHPNIIETYGFFLGDNEHRPSILLEYCPFNLSQVIKKLAEIEQITVIYEICQAMVFVHMNNIIHRDLKPENILLDEFYHVKLSDFGISTLIDIDAQQRTGDVGTVEFMAPELFGDHPEYDEKVDVYAFGIVMYFVLTHGQYPNAIKAAFARKNIEIPRSINALSKDLIQKCLSVNPKDRPSFDQICKIIEKNNYMLVDGVEKCKPDILSRLAEV